MCKGETEVVLNKAKTSKLSINGVPVHKDDNDNAKEPSLMARYTCASILIGIMGIWMKYTFVSEEQTPAIKTELHSYMVPLGLTTFYLISLPILRWFTSTFLLPNFNMKSLLKESMVCYNVIQVVVNFWMVYTMVDGLVNKGHPFIGDTKTITVSTTYAIWVHYCNKYLEFLDTYFMVLRGNYKQVSFLHVYHHYTISWAWWYALLVWPAGDSYFGALCNSWIHVMMYSYYALSIFKIPCPWKKYITQAQLIQFCTVIGYTIISATHTHGKLTSREFSCYIVQVFEMASLFVLFSYFYMKTYNDKKKQRKAAAAAAASAKKIVTDVPPNSKQATSSPSSSVATAEESIDNE